MPARAARVANFCVRGITHCFVQTNIVVAQRRRATKTLTYAHTFDRADPHGNIVQFACRHAASGERAKSSACTSADAFLIYVPCNAAAATTTTTTSAKMRHNRARSHMHAKTRTHAALQQQQQQQQVFGCGCANMMKFMSSHTATRRGKYVCAVSANAN